MVGARYPSLRFALVASCIIGILPGSCVLGAELLTEAEQMYSRLNEAEGVGHKPLAERWYKLVRQRQWVDSTGKHKAYARYVDHDPNFQWVKLLVTTKKGDQQTYKEGQVPLARLGKAEQAVVKRIAVVRKQVETALGASPQGETLLTAEGGVSPEFASLPGEIRDGEAPPESGLSPVGGPEGAASFTAASAIMAEPWRTDFAAFASNLSAETGPDGTHTLKWGSLAPLEQVHMIERAIAHSRKKPKAERPSQGERIQLGMLYGWQRGGLGEVRWEAKIDGVDAAADGALKHDLQLPEPFKLVLVPERSSAAQFARNQTGERVRFVGRFKELGGFGDAPVIKLEVRPDTNSPPQGAELSSAPGRDIP